MQDREFIGEFMGMRLKNNANEWGIPDIPN
jgi:hypothetical protein